MFPRTTCRTNGLPNCDIYIKVALWFISGQRVSFISGQPCTRKCNVCVRQGRHSTPFYVLSTLNMFLPDLACWAIRGWWHWPWYCAGPLGSVDQEIRTSLIYISERIKNKVVTWVRVIGSSEPWEYKQASTIIRWWTSNLCGSRTISNHHIEWCCWQCDTLFKLLVQYRTIFLIHIVSRNSKANNRINPPSFRIGLIRFSLYR